MTLLQFIFQSFWHFAGTLVLLAVATQVRLFNVTINHKYKGIKE